MLPIIAGIAGRAVGGAVARGVASRIGLGAAEDAIVSRAAQFAEGYATSRVDKANARKDQREGMSV